MRVREVRAEEWETLRELRLRALADAPEAFARTHAEEAAYPEELWRRRAAGGPDTITLIAERDRRREAPGTSGGVGGAERDRRVDPPGGIGGGARPRRAAVGMATVRLEGEPSRGHLLGMWVDPAARRHGVARALIERAAGWATSRGAAELVLWVVDRNTAARRLYETAGFEPTGDHQPLPSRPELTESKLRRKL